MCVPVFGFNVLTNFDTMHELKKTFTNLRTLVQTREHVLHGSDVDVMVNEDQYSLPCLQVLESFFVITSHRRIFMNHFANENVKCPVFIWTSCVNLTQKLELTYNSSRTDLHTATFNAFIISHWMIKPQSSSSHNFLKWVICKVISSPTL